MWECDKCESVKMTVPGCMYLIFTPESNRDPHSDIF